jgi:hypothetical protein
MEENIYLDVEDYFTELQFYFISEMTHWRVVRIIPDKDGNACVLPIELSKN